MIKLFLATAISFAAPLAHAAGIDPATTEFPWVNGSGRDARYKLADNASKVHILEVWRSSCTWCNSNAAQVKELAEQYAGDQRVQFLDLGQDTADSSYTQWIRRHAPSYPVVKDVGSAVFNALRQADGVPQTYVIDCHGRLVDYTVGYWGDGEKETLKAAISRAKHVVCD